MKKVKMHYLAEGENTLALSRGHKLLHFVAHELGYESDKTAFFLIVEEDDEKDLEPVKVVVLDPRSVIPNGAKHFMTSVDKKNMPWHLYVQGEDPRDKLFSWE